MDVTSVFRILKGGVCFAKIIDRFQSLPTRFYYKKHFYSNARLKLAKNQANVKQYTEAELFLFENYSYSSSKLSSKNNSRYSKKETKEEVCL